MSPWFILAIVVAAGAACGEAYHAGHVNGATAQKVVDQAGIDKINADLTAQKTLSRKIVADSEQHALDDERNNQQILTEIDHHDQDAQAKTAAVERKYAGASLQYGIPASAAGRGLGRPDGLQSPASAASAAPQAVAELPGPLAARLRLHAADADATVDDYAKCLDYEGQVTAWLAAQAKAPPAPSSGP